MEWNRILREQLSFHWEHQLRPRLDGLTDEEYLWEPAPDSWSLRRGPDGRLAPDWEWPPPDPAPVTTIAWRLLHISLGVLAMRSASHFGRAPVDFATWEYADGATQALAQLDREYATWLAGVAALGEDGLSRPCGPAEGPYAESAMAELVLHIHREVIHHGAEVSLLRDLHLRQRAE